MKPFLTCFLLLALLGCEAQSPPDEQWDVAASGLFAADIANNGAFLLAASLEHGGSLWQVNNRERLYNWNHESGRFSLLQAVALSPNGKLALTAERDNLVLWRVQDGQPAAFWQMPAKINALALSNFSHGLVGLNNGEVIHLDVASGKIINRIQINSPVNRVDISADGSLALTGSDDHAARLWDLKVAKQLQEWTQIGAINQVQLSPDQSQAFVHSYHRDAFLYDTRTGKQLASFYSHPRNISAVVFADDNTLYTGTIGGSISRWDRSTGKEIQRWRVPRREGENKRDSMAVLALAITPDGKTLVSVTSNGQAQQWRLPRQ